MRWTTLFADRSSTPTLSLPSSATNSRRCAGSNAMWSMRPATLPSGILASISMRSAPVAGTAVAANASDATSTAARRAARDRSVRGDRSVRIESKLPSMRNPSITRALRRAWTACRLTGSLRRPRPGKVSVESRGRKRGHGAIPRGEVRECRPARRGGLEILARLAQEGVLGGRWNRSPFGAVVDRDHGDLDDPHRLALHGRLDDRLAECEGRKKDAARHRVLRLVVDGLERVVLLLALIEELDEALELSRAVADEAAADRTVEVVRLLGDG